MASMRSPLFVLWVFLVLGAGEASASGADRGSSARGPEPAAAKAAMEALRGHRGALVLFATFADQTDWSAVPEWGSDLLDSSLPGSLSHFYEEMSFGALQVRGATGPRVYRARHEASHYLSADPTEMGAFGAFCQEVIQAADGDVDFALFDNDGPDGVPDSGDDDGAVDAVFIVVPRTPAGFLLGPATGMGNMGQWADIATADAGADGAPVRVVARQGTIQQGRSFAEAAGAMCHEFGHVLGLPDLYDVDFLYRRDPHPRDDSAGIGSWGVMGWGALGWQGLDGPTGMCAVSRLLLGWAEVDEPRQAVTPLELEDVGRRGHLYRIPLGPEEYFLLEYRRPESTYYDRNQPGGGVLVWHVVTEADGRVRADLECADGRWLEAGYPLGQTPGLHDGGDNLDFWAHDAAYAGAHAGNLGDATDPFDGVRYRAFTPDTNPAAYSLDGLSSVRLEDIRLGDASAAATVTVAEAGLALDDVFIGDRSGADLLAGTEPRVHFAATNTGGFSLTDLRLRLSTTKPSLGVPEGEIELQDLAVGAQGTSSWLAVGEPPAIQPARSEAGDYGGVVHVEISAGGQVLAQRDVAVRVRSSILLSGSIVDEGGTGIPHIRALVQGTGGYATAVRSGEDGGFEVYLPPGTYTITANPGDISSTERTRQYASRVVADVRLYSDRSLTVVLLPKHRVTGQVRSTDGAALAGVSVIAQGEGTSGSGRTDDSGLYELWIPRGTYSFLVSLPPDSPDMAPYGVDGIEVTGETPLDIDLPESIALTMRVADEAGAPVGNVSLRLRDDEHGQDQLTRADQQGEATFRVLPGVRYRLYLRGLPAHVLDPSPVAISAEVDTVLQVLLPGAIPVVVRLWDSEGSAIDEAYVSFVPLDESSPWVSARARQGAFVAALKPGRYSVRAGFPAGVEIPGQGLGVIEVADAVDVDFVVDRGVLVQASVTDEEGGVVRGGLLLFTLDPSVQTGDRYWSTSQYSVAADGTVRAPLLVYPYLVNYGLPPSAPTTGDLPPPQALGTLTVDGPRSVRFALRRGVPVEGRVVTAPGTDPAGLSLSATGLDTSAWGRAAVDGDGSFRLRLFPGRYRLTASASGATPVTWVAGEFEAPTAQPLLLREPVAVTFSGRVLDEYGSPVSASLWLLSPCRAGPCYHSQSSARFRASTYVTAATTIAGGATPHPPGTYRITASPDRYDLVLVQQGSATQWPGWVRRDIDLSASREEDFVAPQPGLAYRVSGAASGDGARQLRQIQFLDVETGYCGWVAMEDLAYSIDLPPGRYEVTALLRHPHGGLHGQEQYLGAVEVAGETVWDLRLPDAGTVVGEEDGPRPPEFALGHGYPNPFNAAIVLPFSVAEAGPVEVTVYDLLGQPVRRLTRQWMTPGTHTVQWNGRDDAGRQAASAVYVCRLVSAGRAAAGKVLLLR